MSKKEIVVPDIGDFDEVDVIEVLVRPGDRVEVESPLVVLESDKASMEIPSTDAGEVVEIKIQVGDKVATGHAVVILEVDEASDGAPPPPKSSPSAENKDKASKQSKQAAEPESAPPEPDQPEKTSAPKSANPEPAPEKSAPKPQSSGPDGPPLASPSVRRFARELGVDLARVEGTARKGRILKEDVEKFVKRAMSGGGGMQGIAAVRRVDFAKFGEVEIVDEPRIRKISAANLHTSWVNVPHVTQHDLADVTELEAFRKSLKAEGEAAGAKVTMVALVAKAVAAALHEFPRMNSSLDETGERLVMKRYVHLGVAVDTPDGLIVPVVRDVDKLGLFDLARAVAELAERARAGKLRPADIQGATFSISSLGGIGGTAFTPIVNAPEVGILGLSRTRMEPVWKDGAFVPRLMLPLSLSYDHRVIDGALAARFTTWLGRALTDLRRVLL